MPLSTAWALAKLAGLLMSSSTLPETNISPENRPLEKEIPIGNPSFLGAMLLMLVSGSFFNNPKKHPKLRDFVTWLPEFDSEIPSFKGPGLLENWPRIRSIGNASALSALKGRTLPVVWQVSAQKKMKIQQKGHPISKFIFFHQYGMFESGIWLYNNW